MTDQDFVGRIYEAAILPEMWEEILHDLATSHGFEGGVLFTANAVAQRGVTSRGVRDVFQRFLDGGWASRSERAHRGIKLNRAGFIRDADIFAEHELETDPLHAEILRPAGLGDVAGTVVSCPNGDQMVVSFERALAKGPTPDEVITSFDGLRAHIARSAVIAGRVELERARAQVETMSALGIPGAVLSATGRAIAANAEIEALRTQIEIRARDIFALRDPGSAALLAMAMASGSADGNGRSIPLRGTPEAPPAVLHLLPVMRNGRDVLPNASWLVTVTALGVSGPSASTLCGLFDLSAAEAKVASAVLDGLALVEIAERYGVAVSTVRNQVAAVFAKTGVKRQSDLILLCGLGRRLEVGA